MSVQVDTALVQQYRSNIDIQFQQMGSRLRRAVRVERQNAEFEYYDRIGPTAVNEVTARHADTVLVDTPHSRRRVGMRDFDWADLIDREDKIRMLADPTSPYTQNAAMAFGRKADELILEAITGTAYTGKSGGTAVTTGWGTHAATGNALRIEDLIQARQGLEAAEAIEPGEEIYCVCRAQHITDLLSEDPTAKASVVSSDYNTVKALVAGEIDTFMGFKFIRTELGSTATEVYFFAKGGLLLAIGDEMKVDIGPRRDKRNSMQVYVCCSMAATRLWEEKIYVVTAA